MTPKLPDQEQPERARRRPLLHEEITAVTIAAFYEVYNTLGYGFLEAVYSRALEIELTLRGLRVQRELLVDVYYKGNRMFRRHPRHRC